MGNCHHRLEQFGHAALAWRRALAVAPDHQKARQNLRYLEIKEGFLYKEAHRLEKDPARLPVASYLRVIAERGPWIHMQTPDGEFGWVESENLSTVIPNRERKLKYAK